MLRTVSPKTRSSDRFPKEARSPSSTRGRILPSSGYSDSGSVTSSRTIDLGSVQFRASESIAGGTGRHSKLDVDNLIKESASIKPRTAADAMKIAMEGLRSEVKMKKFSFIFDDSNTESAYQAFYAIQTVHRHRFVFIAMLAASAGATAFFGVVYEPNVFKIPSLYAIFIAALAVVIHRNNAIARKHSAQLIVIKLLLVSGFDLCWMLSLTYWLRQHNELDVLRAAQIGFVLLTHLSIDSFNLPQIYAIFVFFFHSLVSFFCIPFIDPAYNTSQSFIVVICALLYGNSCRIQDWTYRTYFLKSLKLKKENISITGVVKPNSGDSVSKSKSSGNTNTLDVTIIHSQNFADESLASLLAKSMKHLSIMRMEIDLTCIRLSTRSSPDTLAHAIENTGMVVFVLSQHGLIEGKIKNNVTYAYEKNKPVVAIVNGIVNVEDFGSGMRMIMNSVPFISIPEGRRDRELVAKASKYIVTTWLSNSKKKKKKITLSNTSRSRSRSRSKSKKKRSILTSGKRSSLFGKKKRKKRSNSLSQSQGNGVSRQTSQRFVFSPKPDQVDQERPFSPKVPIPVSTHRSLNPDELQSRLQRIRGDSDSESNPVSKSLELSHVSLSGSIEDEMKEMPTSLAMTEPVAHDVEVKVEVIEDQLGRIIEYHTYDELILSDDDEDNVNVDVDAAAADDDDCEFKEGIEHDDIHEHKDDKEAEAIQFENLENISMKFQRDMLNLEADRGVTQNQDDSAMDDLLSDGNGEDAKQHDSAPKSDFAQQGREFFNESLRRGTVTSIIPRRQNIDSESPSASDSSFKSVLGGTSKKTVKKRFTGQNSTFRPRTSIIIKVPSELRIPEEKEENDKKDEIENEEEEEEEDEMEFTGTQTMAYYLQPVTEIVEMRSKSQRFRHYDLEVAYRNYRNQVYLSESRNIVLMIFVVLTTLHCAHSISSLRSFLLLQIMPLVLCILLLLGSINASLRFKILKYNSICFLIYGCTEIFLTYFIGHEEDFDHNMQYQFTIAILLLIGILKLNLRFEDTLVQAASFDILSIGLCVYDHGFNLNANDTLHWMIPIVVTNMITIYVSYCLNLERRYSFVLEKRLAIEHVEVELTTKSEAWEDEDCKGMVFISYKHLDKEIAFRIEKKLKRHGYDVWIDKHILPGNDWRDEIGDAIENSFCLLFLVTPESVRSRYCFEEINYAYSTGIHILPINIRDSFDVMPDHLKLLTSSVQWVTFENRSFREASSDLLNALSRIMERSMVPDHMH